MTWAVAWEWQVFINCNQLSVFHIFTRQSVSRCFGEPNIICTCVKACSCGLGPCFVIISVAIMYQLQLLCCTSNSSVGDDDKAGLHIS